LTCCCPAPGPRRLGGAATHANCDVSRLPPSSAASSQLRANSANSPAALALVARIRLDAHRHRRAPTRKPGGKSAVGMGRQGLKALVTVQAMSPTAAPARHQALHEAGQQRHPWAAARFWVWAPGPLSLFLCQSCPAFSQHLGPRFLGSASSTLATCRLMSDMARCTFSQG
jgi:hypothetical protein